MEDVVRDAVITVGGFWPIVGVFVGVFAICASLAWKLKDDGSVVAGVLAAASIVCLIVVIAEFPAAQARCRRLAADGDFTYVTDKCYEIVTCTVSFSDVPGPLGTTAGGTCSS